MKQGRAQIVISDSHIGTSMWQAAVLKALGFRVGVETLSGHADYLAGGSAHVSLCFRRLKDAPRSAVRWAFKWLWRFRSLEYVLCSFPPSRFEALEKLPERIRIILNIGHRIQIQVSPGRLIEITRRITDISRDKRFRIAAMSEYDFHYVRYYTGVEVERLRVISMHIPEGLRTAPYLPENRVVLIGPSHNLTRIVGFDDDLQKLNALSQAFAAERGLEPYRFEFIKSIYPGLLATPENLARHPAVLVSPYSAFSISMVELYQLNLPFFVPADEMLVDQMDDVRLYPLSQTREATASLDAAFPLAETPYPFSPNDDSRAAQLYWLKFMYFNQVRHAQHFEGPNDFFEKLYGVSLKALHDAMLIENHHLFADQLSAWRTFMAQTG